MIGDTWEDLHRELQACNWFAHVGELLQTRPPDTQLVSSWAEAHAWASAEISWWCANEASNVLRAHLSSHHRLEYRKWNDYITVFSRRRDELLDTVVSPLIPEQYRASKIVDWIRSDLTRAYLERIYSPQADVRLVCNRMDWYLSGRFPCGWVAKDETSFPGEAVTVVF